MTDVSKTPEKKRIRIQLVNAAIQAVERQGWKVAKVHGGGTGRLRRISKNGTTRLMAIRTTQDTWIAFPRNEDDTKWVTLSDVDVIVAASVDDPANPRFAQVHMIDADEMRDRFDRAYAARRAADHTIPLGRGVWVSLYHEEGDQPCTTSRCRCRPRTSADCPSPVGLGRRAAARSASRGNATTERRERCRPAAHYRGSQG